MRFAAIAAAACAMAASLASAEPEIPGDVAEKLGQVRAAYRAVESVSMSGTFKLETVRAGKKEEQSTTFAALFARPNVFRQVLTDESVAGSTGEIAYAYLARLNAYRTTPLDEEAKGVERFGPAVAAIVRGQNPSLAMLLAEDPIEPIAGDLSKISLAGPDVLNVAATGSAGRITLDSKTRLLKKVEIDLTAGLKQRGDDQLEKAVITIDYEKVQPGVTVAEEARKWTPPPGARDAAAMDPKDDQEPGAEGSKPREAKPGGE